MAQAAFFVNDMKIIDKGPYCVLAARRQCGHGHVMDQINLTFPIELKSALTEALQSREAEPNQPERDEPQQDVAQPAWRNRLEKYFEQDN